MHKNHWYVTGENYPWKITLKTKGKQKKIFSVFLVLLKWGLVITLCEVTMATGMWYNVSQVYQLSLQAKDYKIN